MQIYKNQSNKTRYQRARKSSFKTKLDLFVFQQVLLGTEPFNETAFEGFEITPDLVTTYTTEYWQLDYDKKITGSAFTVNELYHRMQSFKQQYAATIDSWEKNYAQQFKVIFPETAFLELLKVQSCKYCGITPDKIEQLGQAQLLFKKSERGWSLEIDRKNSNLEYSEHNCVLACYWCNNAKTDEFTFEEFIEIGKSIEQVWRTRLSHLPKT